MSQPDVSVLIVTYNSSHVIGACLSALGSAYEIIVYDNASSDETVTLIGQRFPSVRVMVGDRNLGFAAGVNRAAAVATGRNIMLLNPDAVIAAEDVRILAETVLSTHGGIVAPLIHTDDVRVAAAGRMPTAWAMATHYFGLSRLARGRRRLQGHYLLPSDIGADPVAVDWVTGACLMVDAQAWRRMGGLSERWFMYAEDIEFCWRMGRSGGAVLVEPRARARHLVGSSSNESVTETDSAWVLNLYDFYRTDLARSGLQRLWWGVVVGTGLAFRALVFRAQALRNPIAGHGRSAREFMHHSRAVFSSLTASVDGR
ncbi:glycosyltransferase family 2 protein [Rhodococcus sp. IEGM 1330]|uniref:glycosyltransferase family 2 protein n=1 Tax=Rhodococcus sp. IEGM 1330 TaxID=3082225 RepID=UPI0029539DC0|nr:glycosyltransferase family 2 protein [Rhodococcus sp. IEGM 1330]MDV8023639.1 glycosyltransferase family 2 protein [Rhodococcus sp. IEGM 1330]